MSSTLRKTCRISRSVGTKAEPLSYRDTEEIDGARASPVSGTPGTAAVVPVEDDKTSPAAGLRQTSPSHPPFGTKSGSGSGLLGTGWPVLGVVEKGLRALEAGVEGHFLRFFEAVQTDMRNNVRLLFFVGICVGGGLGSAPSAWGVGFGLGAFCTKNIECINAAMLSCLFVDCRIAASCEYERVGWLQLGRFMFRVLDRRLIDAYSAGALLLGVVVCLVPSFWLALLIVCAQCSKAASMVVR